MQIVADAVIPHPRPRVFATYRDSLPDLVEHLPNIREIKVISRADRGDEVDLINEWTGGGDIPAAARSVLSDSMMSWTDHATWYAGDFRVVWRTDVHAFRRAVKSQGENRFVEVAGGTELRVRGEFTCDAAQIPGVPRLLAGTVSSAIEKFMSAQIAKNAKEIARGVSKVLAMEGSK